MTVSNNQSAKIDVTGEISGQIGFGSGDALRLEAGGLIVLALLLLVAGVFLLRRARVR